MSAYKWKLLEWIILLFVVAALFWVPTARAEDSAIDELRSSQENRFLETDDDQQNWMQFYLCREMDAMRDLIMAHEEARREDDKELRAQLWKLALLVGGGGAIGGAGGAAVVKAKKKEAK